MGITRRNTLIGLGTLAIGGGAIAGTGAFTTVDADRDVTVAFADDSDAVLGMTPAEDLPDFITVEEDGGEIGISIEQINLNARTQVDDLVTFTNNDASPITSISFSLDAETENAEFELTDESLDLDDVGGELTAGESETGLGFIIETRDAEGHEGTPSIEATITITAET